MTFDLRERRNVPLSEILNMALHRVGLLNPKRYKLSASAYKHVYKSRSTIIVQRHL